MIDKAFCWGRTREARSASWPGGLRWAGLSLMLVVAIGSPNGVHAQTQKEKALAELQRLRGHAATSFHCVFATVDGVLYSETAALATGTTAAQPGIGLLLSCNDEKITFLAPPAFQKEIVDLGLMAMSTGRKVLIVYENGRIVVFGFAGKP